MHEDEHEERKVSGDKFVHKKEMKSNSVECEKVKVCMKGCRYKGGWI